jgi:GNAT superfamily N-acetyltransferase
MLTIRHAKIEDIPIVWQFVQKKAAFDNWLDKLQATPEMLAKAMFADPPQMGVLLAEQDDRAVGFASYFFTFSTYMGRRCLWLDDLYVEEDLRRKGIGTALLRDLAKLAVKLSCPRVEWLAAADNARAISFYQQLGADVKHSLRLCRLDEPSIKKVAEGRI